MSRRPEEPLTFRPLYEGPIVRVSEYRCRAGRGGPAGEEYSDVNNIVLMRAGAFCKHFGRRSITADVNQAVFFSQGSTYRVSHPADCGDRGTILAVSPRVLTDIVRELDPSVDDHPDRPFPFVTGPCDPGVFRRHRELREPGCRRTPPARPAPDRRDRAPAHRRRAHSRVRARTDVPRCAGGAAPRPITRTAPRRPSCTWRAGWASASRSTTSPGPCTPRRSTWPASSGSGRACRSIAI